MKTCLLSQDPPLKPPNPLKASLFLKFNFSIEKDQSAVNLISLPEVLWSPNSLTHLLLYIFCQILLMCVYANFKKF